MSRIINLANIQKGKSYRISDLRKLSSTYREKLIKMGFVSGTPIERASVQLQDPIILQIRGSRIALRKKEAQQILVKEF